MAWCRHKYVYSELFNNAYYECETDRGGAVPRHNTPAAWVDKPLHRVLARAGRAVAKAINGCSPLAKHYECFNDLGARVDMFLLLATLPDSDDDLRTFHKPGGAPPLVVVNELDHMPCASPLLDMLYPGRRDSLASLTCHEHRHRHPEHQRWVSALQAVLVKKLE